MSKFYQMGKTAALKQAGLFDGAVMRGVGDAASWAAHGPSRVADSIIHGFSPELAHTLANAPSALNIPIGMATTGAAGAGLGALTAGEGHRAEGARAGALMGLTGAAAGNMMRMNTRGLPLRPTLHELLDLAPATLGGVGALRAGHQVKQQAELPQPSVVDRLKAKLGL